MVKSALPVSNAFQVLSLSLLFFVMSRAHENILSPRTAYGENEETNPWLISLPPPRVSARNPHTKALKIRFPDSRIHVYGSDKDCVENYDWGPDGRFPTAHFWDPDVRRVLRMTGFKVPGFN